MRITIPAALLAAALFLPALLSTSNTALAQGGVCQANPSPVDEADPSIIVDSPTAGSTASSPLTVSGQARTFEANVVLTLFDASGNEIATTNGLAAEGGVLSPFSIDISFSVSADTEACLWVFESSAQDGSPINVVQVPLTLSASGEPLSPVVPAATGTGDGDDSSVPPAVVLAGLAALAITLTATGAFIRRRD
jgi:Immunoglobulin-like domain of bacterial spore germination